VHHERIGLDADAAAAALVQQRRVAQLKRMMRAEIHIAGPLDAEALEDVEHGKILAMLRVGLPAEPLVLEVEASAEHLPCTNSSATRGSTCVIQS
jgi:hypothetical protein